jgi:hypothetical protein
MPGVPAVGPIIATARTHSKTHTDEQISKTSEMPIVTGSHWCILIAGSISDMVDDDDDMMLSSAPTNSRATYGA